MTRAYVDAGLFLAVLNGNEQFSPEAKSIMEAGEQKKVEIVTSFLTVSEVVKRRVEGLRKLRNDEQVVTDFMDAPFIRYVALEYAVSNTSRYVVWDTNSQPRDAIHLASAMQSGCSVFYTTDQRLVNRSNFANQRIRLPRISLPEFLTDLELPLK